jgi:predicted O-methyltransferase YrrM
LEFGIGSGYSAIWIAKGLPDGGHLITIERDKGCIQVARENIAQAGVEKRVIIVEGDAQEGVSTLTETFDFMFVDCAHPTAFESSWRVLRRGGLFVCDNVGYRNKDTFNEALTTCPHVETLYVQCYLKGRIPENTAMSISIRR